MEAADEGEPRYQIAGKVTRAAEAIAEHEAVVLVRTAGHDARFWAAPATWLERKFPQQYGRRQEDSDGPKVIVQIGGKVASRQRRTPGVECLRPHCGGQSEHEATRRPESRGLPSRRVAPRVEQWSARQQHDEYGGRMRHPTVRNARLDRGPCVGSVAASREGMAPAAQGPLSDGHGSA